jgi:hypothetical protein
MLSSAGEGWEKGANSKHSILGQQEKRALSISSSSTDYMAFPSVYPISKTLTLSPFYQ